MQQKSLRPLSEPLQLSCLPHEILVEIMKNVEWDDILVLRKARCCRSLNVASKEREVWCSLLKRYCETTFPRPFFLSKPLQHSTREELEARIVGWWSGWEHLTPTTQTFSVHGHIEGLYGPLAALPGNRYFLYDSFEGSVYYGDPLDLASTLTPLLPSPFKGPLPAGACVSVDVLATQGIPIDPDIPVADATWESRLFPLAFRLAVCRRQSKMGFIEVYDITVQIQDGNVRYSSTQLKSHVLTSYDEVANVSHPCSLLGNYLAYGTMSNGVRIINWTSYDPGDPTTRICPPSILDYVLLLPNRRILLMGYNVSIWDWEQGRRLVAENSPDAWSTPDWESSDFFDLPHPFTSPVYIRGSIRLVLVGTDDVLLGVIIPMDTEKRGTSEVSTVRLLETPTSLGHTTRWFGYRKGAYIGKDSEGLVCYKWPDDDLPPQSHQSIRLPGQFGDMDGCFQVDGDYRRLVAFSFKSPLTCTVFG
ncbi:hypothetical protein CC1G_08815 [Coprinopsis cinerea okayama7|uniref:F-box domain-containing protein n=1 Tax=Coprinopsis cinerea (strain Okayama-7 / 130 / ATCC MYA-4618 / FGSC 9003) TaxID=240176 RepID=A8N465_COPC7|nr:hypothetical protein CC1G_08815 [Coprinopsis cinerea okayama7\|eukprot:XP_001829660.2 hypothetical protein CC1G_08815 [Coprinopsis cinerea okayama7\